jgi:transposase
VRDWVAAHADAIALFYLPSYSPELNPDEYLNGALKLSVARRAPARRRDDLLKTATSRLRSLQRRPEQVKRFFQHPRVRYAA